MAETIRESLRRRFPGLARGAAGNSQKAAIHLFCLECMGGGPSANRDARTCATKDCALWPFGPAGRKARGEVVEDDGGAEAEGA